MKKGYIKLLCLNIFSIIVLLLSNFVLDKINYLFLTIFMIVLGVIAYFLIGFEKERSENQRSVRFNVIVITIFYLLFTYILGIFASFTRTVYSLTILGILKNLIMVLPFLILTELYRYQVVQKGRDYKICLILSYIFFVLLGVLPYLKGVLWSDANNVISFLCTVFLPIVSKELMLMYISYTSGYYATFTYCVLMDLNMYYMPISPNFGIYINAVLKIIYPSLLIVMAYKITNTHHEKVNVRKNKKYRVLSYSLSVFVLTVLVLLVSGVIKYKMLTIGSDSMNPVIYKGDAIVIEKLEENEKNFKVDDIIAFKKNNMIIVHRVTSVEDGGEYYYTKGDNNDAYDGYPVSRKDIVGIYHLRIPLIGYPTVWLNEVLLG